MGNSLMQEGSGYNGWLGFPQLQSGIMREKYKEWCRLITSGEDHPVMHTAVMELRQGLESLLGQSVPQSGEAAEQGCITLRTFTGNEDAGFASLEKPEALGNEGYVIRRNTEDHSILVAGMTPAGVLYGVFHLLRLIGTDQFFDSAEWVHQPVNELRMINQWDNVDGSIERGYAGRSIFYNDNEITQDDQRVSDYARLLASVGINSITINNVNVHQWETLFLTDKYLPDIARLAGLFRKYAIRLFLSVNFAAPLEIGGLGTADPLDPAVREWWKGKAEEVYRYIPDFGGFLVKADSENRPGPFTYGRNHADGANMLAEALEPHGGLLIWRCFVYNCKQDWRDRITDRARSAYDHFTPLDGSFHDNVILQIKNGPMDFQVREPVSPLLGALEQTNQVIEFQITQEYTGQQRHVCYLVPQWKEVLDFDTHARGEGSYIKRIVDGSLWGSKHSGFAAVSNIGNDANWTGHLLAQANLYGYGRLAWNPELTSEEIAEEWVRLTFGGSEDVVAKISEILLKSWSIYESYTAPLGVGWMVNPEHHYGPNVDGYEYSPWGTYHFADCRGIGVNRTVESGTGYAGQYIGPNAEMYEYVASCPEELLLFFHHVSYRHVLRSGKTVIQHIYDTHFEGVEQADELLAEWNSLAGSMHEGLHEQVAARLQEQAEHSREWRDRINTYFFRKSGIEDAEGRLIY